MYRNTSFMMEPRRIPFDPLLSRGVRRIVQAENGENGCANGLACLTLVMHMGPNTKTGGSHQ